MNISNSRYLVSWGNDTYEENRTGSVVPQSKKISKSKPNFPKRQSPKESQHSNEFFLMETGYDTFLPEEKEQVLLIFKRHILAYRGLESPLLDSKPGEKPRMDWVNLMKEIGPKSVNNVLREVIPHYRPNLDLTTKELTNLRKKIKGWFKSEGVTEKRGNPLIHDDELPQFKQMLTRFMKVRNFEQLRQDVLPSIKRMRLQSSKKFDDRMFSKKFWSTFLNKEENSDIKALWERLPQIKDLTTSERSSKGIMRDEESSSSGWEKKVVKMRPRQDGIVERLTVSSQQRGMWERDEKKESQEETYIEDFINKFDENKPQYPLSRFLADTESIQMASSEDRQMCVEEKPKTDFFEDFWSAWNERSLAKNEFSVLEKNVQLPESESSQRFEWQLFNNNSNHAELFGLSQDSYKQAYFST